MVKLILKKFELYKGIDFWIPVFTGMTEKYNSTKAGKFDKKFQIWCRLISLKNKLGACFLE